MGVHHHLVLLQHLEVGVHHHLVLLQHLEVDVHHHLALLQHQEVGVHHHLVLLQHLVVGDHHHRALPPHQLEALQHLDHPHLVGLQLLALLHLAAEDHLLRHLHHQSRRKQGSMLFVF